jgi:hypothetical protein
VSGRELTRRKKAMHQIEALPSKKIAGRQYLSYQAVTETVAAFLYPAGTPTHPTDQMEADDYQPSFYISPS